MCNISAGANQKNMIERSSTVTCDTSIKSKIQSDFWWINRETRAQMTRTMWNMKSNPGFRAYTEKYKIYD